MATRDENGNFVYPLIPKYLYKPVMAAYKAVKNDEDLNDAAKIAAEQFGVDADAVKRHVMARFDARAEYYNRKRIEKMHLESECVEPSLKDRRLTVEIGSCKDCKFCKVGNVHFSFAFDKYENKVSTVVDRLVAIARDESITPSVKTCAAKRIVGDAFNGGHSSKVRMPKGWQSFTKDQIRDFLNDWSGFDPVVVCVRNPQARITITEHRLAFPRIPTELVLQGKIGCGEFDSVKKDNDSCIGCEST